MMRKSLHLPLPLRELHAYVYLKAKAPLVGQNNSVKSSSITFLYTVQIMVYVERDTIMIRKS